MQYERRMGQLQVGLEQARFHGTLAAVLLALAFAVLLMLSLLAFRQQVSFLWSSVPIPFAAASALRFRRYRLSRSRMWRLQRFYDRAIQRVKGNWVGSGAKGEEFSDPDHVYARELNIFGEGSLFEMLCTARTAIGQRGLADYLLKAPSVEETLSRQEAVRELRGQVDLRERVALLGEFEFFESKSETFAEWLNLPTVSFSRPLRIAAFITSTLVAATVVGGLTGLVPWISAAIWIAPLVALHSVVGLLFRNKVNRMIVSLRPVSFETQVLRGGLRLLEQRRFQSLKLRQIASQVQGSSKSVRKVERLLNALNERTKEWFYGPSLLLLVGTQLCMAIEHWRIEHRAALRAWLDAWAEFEALNALANYAYENAENTFPEFSTEGARFEAEGLGHPLLVSASCVTNDVQLNRDSRFYVVSGSNMSGKSTLLRAIGLNAVLAFAGAPVRARVLRLSRLSVCASLSVVDSLLNGKSKFMAEVDRLRQTIQVALEGESVLFLIDEIFGGTNSRDRRVAAEAVVRTLVNRGAIGALSTHDLALSEIAASDLCGVNVHTGSRDGSDPMDFDYRLKPGVTNETNALAIARMAGVPI
jgi:ABC-type multidrug transport system fused ATPase/permease subunit